MFFKNKSQEMASAVGLEPDDMPGAIQISPSLQAAIDMVRMLDAAHKQIEDAFSAAKAGMETAQRELQESSERLAVVESGTALSGGDVDLSVRKAHLAVRDAVEFATAKVNGLESRWKQSAAALADARAALAGEWEIWTREQAEATLRRYERALDTFIAEAKVVKAAAAALGHRLNDTVSSLQLPDPRSPHRDLANPARLKVWQDVPAAVELNRELAEVAEKVLPLIRGAGMPAGSEGRDAA